MERAELCRASATLWVGVFKVGALSESNVWRWDSDKLTQAACGVTVEEMAKKYLEIEAS